MKIVQGVLIWMMINLVLAGRPKYCENITKLKTTINGYSAEFTIMIESQMPAPVRIEANIITDDSIVSEFVFPSNVVDSNKSFFFQQKYDGFLCRGMPEDVEPCKEYAEKHVTLDSLTSDAPQFCLYFADEAKEYIFVFNSSANDMQFYQIIYERDSYALLASYVKAVFDLFANTYKFYAPFYSKEHKHYWPKRLIFHKNNNGWSARFRFIDTNSKPKPDTKAIYNDETEKIEADRAIFEMIDFLKLIYWRGKGCREQIVDYMLLNHISSPEALSNLYRRYPNVVLQHNEIRERLLSVYKDGNEEGGLYEFVVHREYIQFLLINFCLDGVPYDDQTLENLPRMMELGNSKTETFTQDELNLFNDFFIKKVWDTAKPEPSGYTEDLQLIFYLKNIQADPANIVIRNRSAINILHQSERERLENEAKSANEILIEVQRREKEEQEKKDKELEERNKRQAEQEEKRKIITSTYENQMAEKKRMQE